jgi:hypothetical protein
VICVVLEEFRCGTRLKHGFPVVRHARDLPDPADLTLVLRADLLRLANRAVGTRVARSACRMGNDCSRGLRSLEWFLARRSRLRLVVALVELRSSTAPRREGDVSPLRCPAQWRLAQQNDGSSCRGFLGGALPGVPATDASPVVAADGLVTPQVNRISPRQRPCVAALLVTSRHMVRTPRSFPACGSPLLCPRASHGSIPVQPQGSRHREVRHDYILPS